MNNKNNTISNSVIIKQLKEQGWTVKIEHFRLCQDDLREYHPKYIKKNIDDFLRSNYDLMGPYRAAKGGRTIILVSRGGESHKVVVNCSLDDAFNKKTGVQIGLERLLNKWGE